jgi:hypothetical protein
MKKRTLTMERNQLTSGDFDIVVGTTINPTTKAKRAVLIDKITQREYDVEIVSVPNGTNLKEKKNPIFKDTVTERYYEITAYIPRNTRVTSKLYPTLLKIASEGDAGIDVSTGPTPNIKPTNGQTNKLFGEPEIGYEIAGNRIEFVNKDKTYSTFKQLVGDASGDQVYAGINPSNNEVSNPLLLVVSAEQTIDDSLGDTGNRPIVNINGKRNVVMKAEPMASEDVDTAYVGTLPVVKQSKARSTNVPTVGTIYED